jgi:hypothetical protein
MLSTAARGLTYLLAVLYTILGGILFLLPAEMAPIFAWKVTPFMTMTIGGWCLGNAWLAWLVARRWDWGITHTGFVYLWLFGLLETGVLAAFRDKLQLSHPIAWLYLATLLVNVLAALTGLWDWSRLRPTAAASSGPEVFPRARFFATVFVLFVIFLGLYGISVPIGGFATNGEIFPEPMTAFTLRSFAVFYLSLALASVPLLRQRSRDVFLFHACSFYGFIAFITTAAFWFLPLFDFPAFPVQVAYFAAYLVVGVPLLFVFRRFRADLRRVLAM